MKYGIWNAAQPRQEAVNALVSGGFRPLTAMILAARGLETPEKARAYLRCDTPLLDPFAMKDMDLAVARVRAALEKGERIAVFGDYDVDGITATCLLTHFLRSKGADCVSYIPGRLEEGYGLNAIAIRQLHGQGVQLIITVDCGITAVKEAELCRQLGIDLVITDHHECKDALPRACAIVDPHRPDASYPHRNLSGVGIAFKLAAALSGDQEQILADYADMVCLGTVADVMLLQGENRVFVARGLELLKHTKRAGIAALMEQCGCDPSTLTANSIGFMLAPRINAAGRMGRIELAVELFLTEDPERAAELATALCELNRQRQAVEAEIYTQAMEKLPSDHISEAIVLADDRWHQGVVGIVSSRISEEYCCPAFLICLDGEHGKASSRSYGGFNLFGALTTLSEHLESYGGHELAAGFTIQRSNIDAFREAICRLAGEYYNDDIPRTQLELDCAVPPELLTLQSIADLELLEPCGNGCPKPVLMMEQLTVDRVRPVGNGKHLRLRLCRGNYSFNAIYFSAAAQCSGLRQGEVVDVAFMPQINEYRGERSVQMNVLDIRPSCHAACSPELEGYQSLRKGQLTAAIAEGLLPDRATLALVWRYLAADRCAVIEETPMCLCRQIVRWSNLPLSLGKLMTCLDIFADVGLLQLHKQHKHLTVRITPGHGKADLSQSRTMKLLTEAKES